MSKYLCEQLETDWLGRQNCTSWVEYVASEATTSALYQDLAITQAQSDALTLAIFKLFVTVIGYRFVLNILQRRRF